MATTTAQIQLTTSLRLTQADILTLSSKPVIIVPAASGFINIFEKATLTYNYKNTPFGNLASELGFYLVPTQPDSQDGTVPGKILISNSLGAQSVIGASQITSSSFNAANPYPGQFSKLSISKAAIVLCLGDGTSALDPTGGDPASTLRVSLQYSIVTQ
jgi:hypothetical protein